MYILLLQLLEKEELVCNLGNERFSNKIILSSQDNIFLSRLIEGDNCNPVTLSQKKLLWTMKFMNKKINEHNEQSKFNNFIRNHLVFAKMKMEQPNLAIQIFQSQNDRGKQLTYVEKLKSLMMFYDERYNKRNYIDKIQDVFGDLYFELDESINLGFYHQEEQGENELLRTFYTQHLIPVENKDIWWHSIEVVYNDYFKKSLKETDKDRTKIKEHISDWVEGISNAVKFL